MVRRRRLPDYGKLTEATIRNEIERGKEGHGVACSPRRRRSGRRGRRELEVAGIINDVGPKSKKGTADSRRFTSSRLA